MDPRQHCLQAGESLPLVAERYDLPGWQSLYFSGCNLTFRQQHPDPWNLPEGAVLSIPELGDEQRQVLTWRMGMLERIEKDVSAAAREQIDSLQGLKLELAGGAEGQRPMLGRVLATVVRSTVNAMHMVKFFEAGMSTQNGFLALDAAARWDLSDLGQAAGLANLLGRAADGIHAIDQYLARQLPPGFDQCVARIARHALRRHCRTQRLVTAGGGPGPGAGDARRVRGRLRKLCLP